MGSSQCFVLVPLHSYYHFLRKPPCNTTTARYSVVMVAVYIDVIWYVLQSGIVIIQWDDTNIHRKDRPSIRRSWAKTVITALYCTIVTREYHGSQFSIHQQCGEDDLWASTGHTKYLWNIGRIPRSFDLHMYTLLIKSLHALIRSGLSVMSSILIFKITMT